MIPVRWRAPVVLPLLLLAGCDQLGIQLPEDPKDAVRTLAEKLHTIGCKVPAATRVGLLEQFNAHVEGGVSIACSEDDMDVAPADVSETAEKVKDAAAEDEEQREDDVRELVDDGEAEEATKD